MSDGHRPFHGDQITAILLKIVNEDPPPIEHSSLGLPESAEPVLKRALAKDRAQRYASGAELIDALRSPSHDAAPPTVAAAPGTMGVAHSISAPKPSPASAPATIRAAELSTSRRSLPVVAVASLALVAVVLLWSVSGSRSDAPPDSDVSAAPGTSLVEVEEVGFFGRLIGADAKLNITVPAGTAAAVELDAALTSETAAAGDDFSATLKSPIIIEGYEAIGSGSRIEGHVARAAKAGKVSGTGELTLEFDRIVTADGQTLAIESEPHHQKARTTRKKDAAKLGGAAGIGAFVGGLLGGKKGAAIGGAVGGSAGGAAVMATKGEEVVLAAGTELYVQLKSPLTVTIVKEADE